MLLLWAFVHLLSGIGDAPFNGFNSYHQQWFSPQSALQQLVDCKPQAVFQFFHQRVFFNQF